MKEEIEAYIQSLLDITDNNYIEAVYLVCKDIEIKSGNSSSQHNWLRMARLKGKGVESCSSLPFLKLNKSLGGQRICKIKMKKHSG